MKGLSPLSTGASTDNSSIDEAFRRWNVARTALASTFQTYMDEFSHFEIVYNQHFGSLENGVARWDIHSAIDQEALSLSPFPDSIVATRATLLHFKNKSRFNSPIARLPAELLARVLTISVESLRSYYATTRPCDQSVDQLQAIASVCSYWRDTAIGISALWSYIDWDRMRHQELALLWIKRAHNCPLDIVSQSDPESQRWVNSSVKCLRSIFLWSIGDITDYWVSKWYSNGAPRTLTTLSLSSPGGDIISFPPGESKVTRGHMEELLYSLDTLHLYRIAVDWNLMACRSLVTLSLESLDIALWVLQGILIANSGLQHIYLKNLKFKDGSPATNSVSSIQLNQLRTLLIITKSGDEAAGILAMVAPGTCDLTLLVPSCRNWELNDIFRRAFVEFCQRSRIKRLSCASSELLKIAATVVPQLEVLALHGLKLSDEFCNFLVPPRNGNAHIPFRPFPYLHTLHTTGYQIDDFASLGRICSTYPIRNIGMSDDLYIGDNRYLTSEEAKRLLGSGLDVKVILTSYETEYIPSGPF